MSCVGFNGGVVLVIGGAGFLGQHIIRELQLSDFDEIRVFDNQPYVKNFDDADMKPVVSVIGSVCNPSEVEASLVGVAAVIHVAGIIDVSLFPDHKLMRAVNVQGTKNVVDACLKLGVSYLVYTSSAGVLIGYDDIINGDESLVSPKELMFKGYGGTKRDAERLVLAANGMKLAQGEDHFLHSLALRPTGFFGEGDKQNVTQSLKTAKSCGGVLMRVDIGSAMQHLTYAGNIAWAHVRALYAMREDSNVGGLAYNITDDAPLKNPIDALAPILASRGYRISKCAIPYWFFYTLTWILELILKMIRPFHKYNVLLSLPMVKHMRRTCTFNRTLAEKNLNYTVKYSYSESLEKSLSYYRNIEL